jgi:hypothetical protein
MAHSVSLLSALLSACALPNESQSMANLPTEPRLFHVDVIHDDTDGCIKADFSIKSSHPSRKASARFCDPSEVLVVRGAYAKQGFVGLSGGQDGNPILTPATVALKLRVVGRDADGALQIMAPPRPMVITLLRGQQAAERDILEAEKSGAAAVFVLADSVQIVDYSIISRESAQRMLGMTTKRP